MDEDRIDWLPPKNEFYAFLSIEEVEVAEFALRLYVTSRAGRCRMDLNNDRHTCLPKLI